MKLPFDWTCPYCDRAQIVTRQNYCEKLREIEVGETRYQTVGLMTYGVRCSNPNCNELYLLANLYTLKFSSGGYVSSGNPIDRWLLRPESSSKPVPDYIPKPLAEDYREACLVRDKSPKASATLARRCLQGMIRDFCDISEKTLYLEIKKLEELLDEGKAPQGVLAETVQAIHAVRKIGNIGAHMEHDINFIVDVDTGEAQALIDLIELLFEEWYVARHKRQEKLARITAIAEDKAKQIENGKAAQLQIKQQTIGLGGGKSEVAKPET